MIDHGLVDKFCLDGCDANAITPADLTGLLNTLESATGVDQVNIVIEAGLLAALSPATGGADLNTLSKPGRVIVTSTSDNKNAYASADGATSRTLSSRVRRIARTSKPVLIKPRPQSGRWVSVKRLNWTITEILCLTQAMGPWRRRFCDQVLWFAVL